MSFSDAPPASEEVDVMVKIRSSLKRETEAVSPVIATILLVAITVVLAATLYVMVFGFGGNSTNSPPVGQVTKSSVTNGYKFTFTPLDPETVWSDIYFILTDGTNSITFNNITTAEMTSTTVAITRSLGGQDLGTLKVFMNVTDLASNGFVNQGDSFTLTSGGGVFSNVVDYELVLMHKPSAAQIFTMTFRGG